MTDWIVRLIEKIGTLLGAFLLGVTAEKNNQLEKESKGNAEKNKIHNKVDTDSKYRDNIRKLFDK